MRSAPGRLGGSNSVTPTAAPRHRARRPVSARPAARNRRRSTGPPRPTTAAARSRATGSRRTSGRPRRRAVTVAAPATSKTITGLTGGTAYTFKVAATNAVGTGPDSAASNSVTPTAPTRAGRADRRQRDRRPGTGDGQLDRPGQQRRQRDHELPGHALHRGDRSDARSRSPLRRPRRRSPGSPAGPPTPSRSPPIERGRHRARLGRLELGHADRADARPARRPASAPPPAGTGDRQLDRAGQQRRQRDHELPGHALHRGDRADAGHGRGARHLEDDHRPHRRHRLHVQGRRDQRGRDRARLSRSNRSRRPRRRARARRPESARAPARNRRRSTGPRRRATAAARSPATGSRPTSGRPRRRRSSSPRPRHLENDHRPDRRHGLHVQGRRGQRDRDRARLGGLELGDADRADSPRTRRPASAPPAGQEQATVNWTAPANNGGSAITSYRVTPYIGTTAQTPVTVAGTGELEDDHRPHRRHRPTRSRSPRSTRSAPGPTPQRPNPVTPTAPDGPGRPDRGERDGRGPAGDRELDGAGERRRQRDHELPGHAIHRSDGPDRRSPSAAPATSKTITGLTGGTAYTFKVAAINAVGTGPDSAASNPVTPTVSNPPGAPTGAQRDREELGRAAELDRSGEQRRQPDHRLPDHPLHRRRRPDRRRATGSTATSASVGGLTNGTAYTFTVAAINAGGAGPGVGRVERDHSRTPRSSTSPRPGSSTRSTAARSSSGSSSAATSPATSTGSGSTNRPPTPAPMSAASGTATGTLLAQANFSGESASGWQQVKFTTPVAITANTTYVAGYLAPRGATRSTARRSPTVSTTRPCTRSRTATSANGVYIYGTRPPGSRPTASWPPTTGSTSSSPRPPPPRRRERRPG